jgi:hypothetical protein
MFVSDVGTVFCGVGLYETPTLGPIPAPKMAIVSPGATAAGRKLALFKMEPTLGGAGGATISVMLSV